MAAEHFLFFFCNGKIYKNLIQFFLYLSLSIYYTYLSVLFIRLFSLYYIETWEDLIKLRFTEL